MFFLYVLHQRRYKSEGLAAYHRQERRFLAVLESHPLTLPESFFKVSLDFLYNRIMPYIRRTFKVQEQTSEIEIYSSDYRLLVIADETLGVYEPRKVLIGDSDARN